MNDRIRKNHLMNRMSNLILPLVPVLTFATSLTAQLFTPGDGVIDQEGNEYATIVYDNGMEFMIENLRTATYASGDAIPHVTSSLEWTGLITGAWCNFDNAEIHDPTYGKLYNAFAVHDERGLCPAGWHVATDKDYHALELFLGMDANEVYQTGGRFQGEGGHFKVTGLEFWNSPNVGASNDFGFSALGGGSRNAISGNFLHQKVNGPIWTGTASSSGFTYYRSFHYYFNVVYRYATSNELGLSVRCIKSELGTGYQEERDRQDMVLFPNPASTMITIRIPEARDRSGFTILDQMGRTIQTGTALGDLHTVDVSMLAAGMYLLRVKGHGQLPFHVVE